MKPEDGSKHRLVWLPDSGGVSRSDVWCTVLAVAPSGVFLRPVGRPTMNVTNEVWAKMIGTEEGLCDDGAAGVMSGT